MTIFHSMKPLITHMRRLNQTLKKLPATLPAQLDGTKETIQRYTGPMVARFDQLSNSVSQRISDKIETAKDKIDAYAGAGVAQSCIDTTWLVLGGVISAPFFLKTGANIIWANVKGFAHESVHLEGQDFVRLYRGVTKQEFDLLMTDQKGPLFGDVQIPKSRGWRDVVSHVFGSYSQDSQRVLTSLSTQKELAAQFSRQGRSFGAVVTFLVPKALYDASFKGMNIHKEVLLQTRDLDRDMIQSVEVRSDAELEEAKQLELLYALNCGPTEDSHRFKTPPLAVFDPKDSAQRAAVFFKLEAMERGVPA